MSTRSSEDLTFPRRLLIEQGGPGHRGPELPCCDVPVTPIAEQIGRAHV